MARPERYFIGPNVRSKLTDLFTRVDGMPVGGGQGEKIPVALQDMRRPGGVGAGASVSIGTYNTDGTQWDKGESVNVHEYEIQTEASGEKTIVPKYENGVPVTTPVLNLFVTIPPNYDRVRYCAYTPINGVNVLVVAEC